MCGPLARTRAQETELPIYRADGALRAVYLPEDGQWTVRFVYCPMSFKLGLYISFLAMMTLLLLAALLAVGPLLSPGDRRQRRAHRAPRIRWCRWG